MLLIANQQYSARRDDNVKTKIRVFERFERVGKDTSAM